MRAGITACVAVLPLASGLWPTAGGLAPDAGTALGLAPCARTGTLVLEEASLGCSGASGGHDPLLVDEVACSLALQAKRCLGETVA